MLLLFLFKKIVCSPSFPRYSRCTMALAANEFGSDSAKSTSRSSSMATWDEGTDTVGLGLGLGRGLGLGSCNGGGNWISLEKKCMGNIFHFIHM